jgi:Protein of unknown function (DUF3828)
MKRTAWFALVLMLLCVSNTLSQTNSTSDPQDSVRRFYTWYLHRLNRNDYNPLKNRTVDLKYLTPEFLRRVPRLTRQMEDDVIVCSQDVDPAWAANFKVDPQPITGSRAIVLLTLDAREPDPAMMKVTLKRLRAGWRIDSVDCGN